jgi:hypothetical protein
MCKQFSTASFAAGRTPEQKTELLFGLAFKPDNSANSARTPLIACTDLTEASEKINKPSVKHK